MGKRHLTKNEIIARCKVVAREARMSDRSPWTAMSITCSYALMKSEGFKGQRIRNVVARINELQSEYDAGHIDVESIRKDLYDKADWTITYEKYTEEDIKSKKGSFYYWLDQKQISPQNAINEQAALYMLFFFTTLTELYGFGKERLTRVQEKINEMLQLYQQDKVTVNQWKKELLEDAGIYFENPIDPLTQKSGSMMTGD